MCFCLKNFFGSKITIKGYIYYFWAIFLENPLFSNKFLSNNKIWEVIGVCFRYLFHYKKCNQYLKESYNLKIVLKVTICCSFTILVTFLELNIDFCRILVILFVEYLLNKHVNHIYPICFQSRFCLIVKKKIPKNDAIVCDVIEASFSRGNYVITWIKCFSGG